MKMYRLRQLGLYFFLAGMIVAVFSSAATAQNSFKVTPASKTFGTVIVGTQSSSASFTVTNTGTTAITVDNVVVTPSQFIFFTGWFPKTLLAGQNTAYDFKFVPDAAGTFSGTATFFIHGLNPVVVTLTGPAVTTSAAATLSVTSLSLGSRPAGQQSTAQTVTVTNTGSSSVMLTSVSVNPPFMVTGFTNSVSLAPGASLPLQVSFRGTTPGAFKNLLVLEYDTLPSNGVALSATVTKNTKLAITSFPTLPQATASAAYSAILAASGGVAPLTFSPVNATAIPKGLTVSSTGVLSGTLDPTVAAGTYKFSIQVTDSTVPTPLTAKISQTLQVLAPTGASCNIITYISGQTGLPQVPINDLGTGTYLGKQGGLYPGGANVRPASHNSAGVSIAQGIQPLDVSGNVDLVNGKIGFLSIGMSDTFDVFLKLIEDANADPTKNPAVVFVPGAQPRASAALYAKSGDGIWTPIFQYFLPQSGVTANQVEVAWVNDGNFTTGTFPANMQDTQANLEAIAQNLHTKFPNLKLAYFGSRFYAGYSNGLFNPANPEPYAYQNGFAAKWTIEDQINGLASLNYDPGKGVVMSPWLSWAVYDWANGMNPRTTDGLIWTCQDLQADGTHPSTVAGREKDSNLLLNFFKTDATTTPWFLKH